LKSTVLIIISTLTTFKILFLPDFICDNYGNYKDKFIDNYKTAKSLEKWECPLGCVIKYNNDGGFSPYPGIGAIIPNCVGW